MQLIFLKTKHLKTPLESFSPRAGIHPDLKDTLSTHREFLWLYPAWEQQKVLLIHTTDFLPCLSLQLRGSDGGVNGIAICSVRGKLGFWAPSALLPGGLGSLKSPVQPHTEVSKEPKHPCEINEVQNGICYRRLNQEKC